MSLDGLRAWIGEVERKLGMRTRVFLVLAVIAIGASGAAIYLALDARDSAVSEGDVQALQRQLETQIGEGGGGGAATGAAVAQLEAELEGLRTQVEGLSGEGGGKGKGAGAGEGGGAKGSGKAGGGATSPGGGASSEGPGGGATGGGASAAQLQELLEKAKEGSEANE